MNAAASSFHCPVSRVTVEEDSPACEPRNCPSAGTKSPDDKLCLLVMIGVRAGAALAMAFKLIESAQRRWRMVNPAPGRTRPRRGDLHQRQLAERPEDEVTEAAQPEAA